MKKMTVFNKIYTCFLMMASSVMLFTTNVKAFSQENENEVKDKLSKIIASNSSGKGDVESKSIFEIFREKFIEFLKDLLDRLKISKKFGALIENSNVPKELYVVIQIFAIVILITIVVLVVFFITKRITRSREIKQEEDALLLNTIKDPELVYKKALEYSNNGDYTLGLRFLYISSLIWFNSLNVIRINKSKTNKQYLVEISENKPEAYDVMVEFTRIFNKHWYGKRIVDQSLFILWHDKYGNLKSSIK